MVTIHGTGYVTFHDNRSYFYSTTSRIMCGVPSKAVFCRTLMLCFTGMLFRYFLSYSEIVRDAPIITSITFVLTSHICCTSIVAPSLFTISRLLSRSNICLLNLQFLLTGIFLFHRHGFWFIIIITIIMSYFITYYLFSMYFLFVICKFFFCSCDLPVIRLYGCCAMNNKEQQMKWIVILIRDVGQSPWTTLFNTWYTAFRILQNLIIRKLLIEVLNKREIFYSKFKYFSPN